MGCFSKIVFASSVLEKSLLLVSTIFLLLLVVGSFLRGQLSPLSSYDLDYVKDHKEQ